MRVTANPGDNEPVRHSSPRGINLQAQRCRSTRLARRRPRQAPRPSRSSHRRDDALGLEGSPRRRPRHGRRRRVTSFSTSLLPPANTPGRISEAYRSSPRRARRSTSRRPDNGGGGCAKPPHIASQKTKRAIFTGCARLVITVGALMPVGSCGALLNSVEPSASATDSGFRLLSLDPVNLLSTDERRPSAPISRCSSSPGATRDSFAPATILAWSSDTGT